jgi:hypothetical protein
MYPQYKYNYNGERLTVVSNQWTILKY